MIVFYLPAADNLVAPNKLARWLAVIQFIGLVSLITAVTVQGSNVKCFF